MHQKARRLERQGLYDPHFEHDACGVGFVANIDGVKSHAIVQKGLTVLENLTHRGACGCDPLTGDGAGLIIQVPDAFLRKVCGASDVDLPPAGEYGVGMVFLPTDAADRRACEGLFEQVVREEGQAVLGWRDVPTDPSPLGKTARAGMPAIRQVFVRRQDLQAPYDAADGLGFERKLYVVRRRAEEAVRASGLRQKGMFYIASLSFKTLLY